MNFESGSPGLQMIINTLAHICGQLIVLALIVLILCAILFKLPIFIKKCWDQFSSTFFK